MHVWIERTPVTVWQIELMRRMTRNILFLLGFGSVLQKCTVFFLIDIKQRHYFFLQSSCESFQDG